jgi:hypothetical protein
MVLVFRPVCWNPFPQLCWAAPSWLQHDRMPPTISGPGFLPTAPSQSQTIFLFCFVLFLVFSSIIHQQNLPKHHQRCYHFASRHL